MGQQQLLLIVLGVIIVGIAVVVGINMFTASSASANQDAVISDLTNLAAMAQQYYRKPAALGGGGNSFTGWQIPVNLRQTSNMGSAMADPTITANSVTLVATGTDDAGGATGNLVVTMVVSPTAITSTTVVP